MDGGSTVRRECQLRRRDGTMLWTEINTRRGADGLYYGIARDVSERKRADRERDDLVHALAARERHLRTVLDSEPECVKLVARNGTLLEMNPAGLAMVEAARPEDVVGRSVLGLIHPGWRRAFVEAHRATFAGERRELEFEIVGLRGTRRVMHSTMAPLLAEDGRVRGVLSITHDVTQRKREELERRALQEQLQQARKMDAIGRLAGGIAHDFNNLITVVSNHAELLLADHGGDEELASGLQEIIDAGQRAAHLTRQLLAFSRKQVLKPETLDVNTVVRGFHTMMGRLLGEDVHLDIGLGDGPLPARCDRMQLEQVLMNLAVNARDAMPRGGQVTITTGLADAGNVFESAPPALPTGRYVTIAVSDTGVGMDAATRARAFEPFFTTKPAGQGTGLGLATVYGIVKQSDGFVFVDSEPDAGTTFTVYLPLAPDAVGITAAPVAASTPGGTETILVAEDDLPVRRLAARLLSARGYQVLEAENGRMALRLIAQHGTAVDAVLTDVVMPVMGGRDLADALARTWPDVPVVFMTGYTDDDIFRRGLALERAPVVEKPFTADSLAAALRAAIDANTMDAAATEEG
jgi:PAS domain S-box-containing protein